MTRGNTGSPTRYLGRRAATRAQIASKGKDRWAQNEAKVTGGRSGIATGHTIGYTSGMKITVSIPESLSEEVKSVAKDLGVSPSKLIRTAVQDFLRRRRDEEVTAALIARGLHADEVDPFLQYLVYEAMKRTELRE